MWGLQQKQNARRADKIRLYGHLRRYKKIVKKTYIIYFKYCWFFLWYIRNVSGEGLILAFEEKMDNIFDRANRGILKK